jgi:hypothetical protein
VSEQGGVEGQRKEVNVGDYVKTVTGRGGMLKGRFHHTFQISINNRVNVVEVNRTISTLGRSSYFIDLQHGVLRRLKPNWKDVVTHPKRPNSN